MLRSGFSAVLIGQSSMTVQCGQVLLDRGHRVVAVVTPTDEVGAWAERVGVPVAGLADLAGLAPFDYLFSVVNLRMLPADVLALPRRGAVNFHDGALPRDAGVHASTWAVLRGATDHAVTWHAMTVGADRGDILRQQPVDIGPEDTSYTLNARCWAAGVASFADLLDDLESGRGTRAPQDPAKRTYHAKIARPPAALVIDWRRGADEIAAAVRAADFGGLPNGFGTVKLWHGSGYAVVGAAEVTADESVAAPGTVMAADPLTVATVTRDVRLIGLTTLHGTPVDLGAAPGQVFTAVEQPDALTAAYRHAMRHEEHWVARLRELEPVDLPHRESQAPTTGWHRLPIDVESDADTALAATLAFLARLTGTTGDVALRVGSVDDRLFSATVPMRLPEPTGDFTAYRELVRVEVARLRELGPYVRDLAVRYPGLDDALPIVVDLDAGPIDPDAVLQIRWGAGEWLLADPRVSLATASSLRDAFRAFVAGIDDLDQAPLVPEHQRVQLAQWNETSADYPRDSCVHQLATANAQRSPDAIAVVTEAETLSYGDLGDRVARLSGVLTACGIGLGDRVAVCLPRSADLVVALLAVTRSGAAYVPLDPIYPRERISGVLDDAAVGLALTHTSLAHLVAGVPAVHLDQPWPSAEPGPDLGRADALAYVIYTSGSTGRPKGVRVGHRALTNFLWSMAREPGFTESDLLLAVTTVCFDIAALELFLPLVCGGTVHIADDTADAETLRDRIDRVRPTVVQATPATWAMLAHAGWRGHPGLRVLCGGEALRRDLADVLLDRADEVWNLYGPTETTIWSTVHRVDRGPITIGRAIANTTLHVLDPSGRPVPIGVPGELWIGGDGVADGYHARPDLTAERFPDGRYRTGDVVRFTRDGQLEYLGRGDHQVKIRGFRVELGEIETVLMRHPAVSHAVVVAVDGALAAYVVLTGSADLLAHARRALPDYMVPSTVTALQRLPRTPNGKIDRKALPAPRAETGGRPPATRDERVLCAAFAAATGRAEVSADDSFFDLGGTSITVAIAVAAAKRAGLAVRAADVFAHRTPAAIAALTEPDRAPVLDLRAEVGLPADIAPPALLAPPGLEPRRVLLTGATGFVGAFLLRELARTATVHCLVRGGRDRLNATLSRYGLHDELADASIVVEDGDLAQPRLGSTRFDLLADSVDAVYHAGAVVNFLQTYHDLKAVNVGATEELLRLAAYRGVPLHHLSSLGVFAHDRWTGRRHHPEDPTGPAEALRTGYQQSKWVAERNALIAADRGLPVTIHRIARVCGDHRTGACQHDDLLWRVLKGCVQAGAAPTGTGLLFDLVPVDHVATAITRAEGGVHHIANPTLTPFDDLVDHLRAIGYPLLDLDLDKWTDLIASTPTNAATPVLDAFTATNTAEIHLAPTPTAHPAPPIDHATVTRHVEFFVRTGFLTPPS